MNIPPPAEVEIIARVAFKTAWIGMACGVVSGAILGLFFHREDWMGGYGSYRRRMARLGHISFFGLAFVNIAFAATVAHGLLGPAWAGRAWPGFLTAACTMPLFCFLSAWRKPFRHAFFIPVTGAAWGIACVLLGGP